MHAGEMFLIWNDRTFSMLACSLNRIKPGTFHDVKAKAISDYQGSSNDKQLFSGHKKESQVLVYDRKIKVSPSLDRPFLSDAGED